MDKSTLELLGRIWLHVKRYQRAVFYDEEISKEVKTIHWRSLKESERRERAKYPNKRGNLALEDKSTSRPQKCKSIQLKNINRSVITINLTNSHITSSSLQVCTSKEGREKARSIILGFLLFLYFSCAWLSFSGLCFYFHYKWILIMQWNCGMK